MMMSKVGFVGELSYRGSLAFFISWNPTNFKAIEKCPVMLKAWW